MFLTAVLWKDILEWIKCLCYCERNTYKELVQKTRLSDEDLAELARLEMFLDEIPDYLALDIATEYKSLKLELENREDY